MTKKQQLTEMTNELFDIIISATSNKDDGDFNSERKNKTVYFTPADEKTRQALVEFGLPEYEPEDGGQPFFIVKASQTVQYWIDENPENMKTLDFSQSNKSNYTTEEQVIKASILFSPADKKKGKNAFYRLQALLDPSEETLIITEPKNPFESLFK